MKLINVFVDGSCTPKNPGGHAHAGALITVRDENCYAEHRISKCIANNASNNIGEMGALVCALEFLKREKLNEEEITIKADSMLVVRAQTTKKPKGMYVPWLLKARELLPDFKNIKFKWIPRENNSRSDDLSHCKGCKFFVESKYIHKNS